MASGVLVPGEMSVLLIYASNPKSTDVASEGCIEFWKQIFVE